MLKVNWSYHHKISSLQLHEIIISCNWRRAFYDSNLSMSSYFIIHPIANPTKTNYQICHSSAIL